ncbi:hypothetical protein SAMN05444274_101295 [Mariniphaga anaerophila]|uniref:Uncharacterized protein n=1 Tax=Mariniphaga anaerophila TaxID=1484053 RepID=A0A1M4T9W6_9BACT|nr:hypothetical protein SAMN05444274_101295 [Mariniphaga anaerophila]
MLNEWSEAVPLNLEWIGINGYTIYGYFFRKSVCHC